MSYRLESVGEACLTGWNQLGRRVLQDVLISASGDVLISASGDVLCS